MIRVNIDPIEVPVFNHSDFPKKYQPLFHQLLTTEVVKNYLKKTSLKQYGLDLELHNYFEKGVPVVIVNTAQTGAGKTLAASSVVFLLHKNAIFSYPTNELIHDQISALSKYAEAFSATHEIFEINRPTLLRRREESSLPFPSQGSLWEHLLKTFKKKIICTNPDIIYYSVIDRYKGTTVAQLLIHAYPIIAYDEFHLANAKQQSGILLTIALAKAFKKPKTFIFLSATPSTIFVQRLKCIQIPVVHIQELEEKVKDTMKSKSHCLPLIGKIDLQITTYPQGVWSADSWIINNFNVIKEYLDKYPKKNVVIILDSVYDAKYIADFLSDALKMNVGQVHGWMNTYERHSQIKKRVVVGSSAIEVGIDFRCHFLIFEAKTWFSFMQRLGRVARGIYKGKAIAIIPKVVYRNLEEKLPKKKPTLTRDNLMKLIKQSFRSYENFESYLRTYMAVEGKIIIDRYISSLTEDEQPRYHEKLYTLLELLTGKKREEIENLHKKTDQSIKNLLLTYRGTRPQFAIFDLEDYEKGWFPFKLYGMEFVLRRCKFVPICFDELMELLEKCNNDARTKIFRKDFWEMKKLQIIISAVKVFSVLSRPNLYTYTLPEQELTKILGKIGVIKNLALEAIRTTNWRSFMKISKTLWSYKFVAFALKGSQYLLAEKYDLPPFFQLHPLKKIKRGHISPGEYSIAFGLDAIMLDSLMKTQKITDNF